MRFKLPEEGSAIAFVMQFCGEPAQEIADRPAGFALLPRDNRGNRTEELVSAVAKQRA